MGLLSAIIMENEGLSLNDLNTIQRMALKKVFTGRFNVENASEKELSVLDSLVDLGLLDVGYDLTPEGEHAANLLSKYSKDKIEDLRVAKQLSAEQEREDSFARRDRVRFSEGEKAIMDAAGLEAEEIAKLFLGENMVGHLTHYVVDPRNKEMVTAFQLGQCENCKGDVQEVNAIQIDLEGAKRLRLKKLDYLPAEITVGEDDDGGETFCDNCYDDAHIKIEADDDYDDEPYGSTYDMSDDGDALASAGMGTGEDYGEFDERM